VTHGREGARALAAHLDAERAAGASEPARADLLGERARFLAAAGEPHAVVRAAWERALDYYLDRYSAFSDIQEALPLRLRELESA